ncbi:MAG TPA: cold shock domain-containing protein [Phycisphaerae bacterium]|nr:cold shock domain-containing protein [Phycisphaerae bacterium]
MPEGAVISISRDFGYGYLRSNEGQTIVFYMDAVEDPDDQSLGDGDRVQFETMDGLNGLVAVRIRRLDAAPPLYDRDL